MKPKVSIVIPVYNGSNYLREAIDSALAQTYQNVEIIVVNDGSNDKGATERIAKSYGDKIKYYKKENGGVATALNLGIKKMSGEYFSWLSHDDMYYPEKLEKQIDFLNKLRDKKVVLYSNYSILQDYKIIPVIHNHEMLVRKKKYSLLRGCVNGITVLVPKLIFDEVGEFDSRLRCTQDYDLWRKVQKKYDFIHMEDALSVTRLHPNQDSVSPAARVEGNELWVDMVKSLTDKEKVEYESTLFNFYFEMVKFLKTTPYDEALEYCEEKLASIEEEHKLDVIDYKISVVIPFYNRPAKTINALNSVLRQSYKNIEIILVNDGSTEGINSLRNFVKQYKNIRLISADKNVGPAAARNIGIKASTGDYIAFLDSDDEFMENKIERQLSEMVKHNLNISYTPYIKRDGDAEVIMRTPTLAGIVVPLIISDCSIATPTAIVRRELLTRHNILFNEKIRVSEDTCFWLEIAKHSEILLVDEPLTVVNVDSSSHAYNEDKVVIGMKNVLIYLLNDAYYSNYNYDISWVCDNFHRINQEIHLKRTHQSPEFAGSESGGLRHLVSRTVPYRIARRFYHDGPKGITRAVLSRVKRKS
jgi:hypothetical protein